MSWKAIDSRAKTSGSALYADTVFYNKTNHNYVKDSQLSGNLTVKTLTVSDNLSVAGVVAADSSGLRSSGDITATSGDITATSGSITATSGNITATNGQINGGTLVSQGDVTCFQSSDQRLKEDITQIENAGETVDKLRGVRFKWREDWFKENEVILAHQEDIGLIAQEVEEVVPELVTDKGNGFKGVAYHKLVPLLLEAVKDLRQDVRRLEGEIKEIRANHD